MTLRSRWLGSLAVLLCTAVSVHAADTRPSFQIVESVPTGTIYGEPGAPRTQAVWLDMIGHAQKRIDIAAFYFSQKPGASGPLARVVQALAARAKAGVKVRILMGTTFAKETHAALAPLATLANVQIRELPMHSLTGGVLHAKYMVVDGTSVFVGSQNWDWRALTEIHEVGARITNARFARTFDAAFAFDWNVAADRSLPKAQRRAVNALAFSPIGMGNPVTLTDTHGQTLTAFPAFSPPALTPRGLTAEQPALVQMIRHARHSLMIQVMTFTAIHDYGPKGWWSEVDSAVRDAAARGVKVRIIIADWALREPMQAYLKSLAVLPNISVKFSRVPPAASGFIPYARVEHAKYAVADDDAAYIGTGNWGWSYFNDTVDASVFVHGTGPADTLTRIFDRDWDGPYTHVLDIGTQYMPPKNH
ncbi:phospholipase D-like domain-containing protein [Oleiagrimonas sp. C23AA]|uniref:phospholipase D-like domain-containing protein n=1 Tax=Oleiagrimonas sp. C23AA TaxID=2719047 RepID=UPI00141F8FF1|nr:phospholipase D-like domain-containing protein [Oleiagrimonas sp. C23AA]NII11650.1 phospholipase [Oleiagrimonas sp. C23AA]